MGRLLRRIATLALVGAAAFVAPSAPPLMPTAAAQEVVIDPQPAIARLFEAGPARSEWFTPDFLAAVPTAQVDVIVGSLTADFGGFIEARIEGTEGAVRLERALVPVSVTLDAEGRIAGLLLRPPEPLGSDARAIAERFVEAAVGTIAILASEEASPHAWRDRVEDGADEPMAVGSAFKLVVLRAYEDAVASGTLGRADVIELTEADRSLPSGVLQTLRPGTPITLEALAGLMIQHSDNTATDALIRALGTNVLEAISPHNRPFLTTAHLFKLIATGGEERRAAYATGDAAERRAILTELAEVPLPHASDLQPRATWKDAEWRITARELCDLLVSLRDAPALNGRPEPLVAPLVERDGWSWVGFKGGSEFGVLNLSAAGTTPDGRTVCAVATANGETAQPEDRLALLFGALFRTLGTPAD